MLTEDGYALDPVVIAWLIRMISGFYRKNLGLDVAFDLDTRVTFSLITERALAFEKMLSKSASFFLKATMQMFSNPSYGDLNKNIAALIRLHQRLPDLNDRPVSKGAIRYSLRKSRRSPHSLIMSLKSDGTDQMGVNTASYVIGFLISALRREKNKQIEFNQPGAFDEMKVDTDSIDAVDFYLRTMFLQFGPSLSSTEIKGKMTELNSIISFICNSK